MRRSDPLRRLIRTALVAMLALAPASALAADGWLGVSMQALDREMREAYEVTGDGVLVTAVVDGSPADRAGLRRHDVIRTFNNRTVSTPDDLRRLVREGGKGRRVTLRVIRDGQGRDIEVRLGGTGDDDARLVPEAPRAPAAPRAPKAAPAPPAWGWDDDHGRRHVEIWKDGKRLTPGDGDHTMPKDVLERLKDLRIDLDDFDGRGFSFMPGAPGQGRSWVMTPGRGQLGVRVEDLNEDLASAMGIDAARGAFVLEVLDDTPAAAAGIRAGDVIVRVDGEGVDDGEDLRRTLRGKGEGSVAVEVLRKGVRRTLTATLRGGDRPQWRSREHGGDDDGDRRVIRIAPRERMELRGGERDAIRREMEELREELRRLREQLRDERR
jgi:membrane-associated protease RseP (regulator of RpoE activity)